MIKLSNAASGALRSWFRNYPIPRSYVAIDLETSGLDVEKDRVIHIGWCTVEDTRTVLSEGVVLDWTRVLNGPELAKFEHDLERTKRSMEARGNGYRWTVDEVRSRGVNPRDALDRFAMSRKDRPMVAHHGWGFDYPMLGNLYKKFGLDFEVPHVDLLDTCLMARAILGPLEHLPNEDYRAYVRRLSQVRCAKHTLRDCVTLFDLHQYGVDPKHGHDAEYDAWVCSLVLERMRELSGTTASAPEQTPEELREAAQDVANMMLMMDPADRRERLGLLKDNNPALHALVLAEIRSLTKGSR